MQNALNTTGMKVIRGKREFLLPFIIVACLFFIWGFITNMNGLLLNHFKFILQLDTFQIELINFTFFAIYFTAAIPAGIIINKIGYKHGIFTGLWVSSLGALIIYFSTIFLSFPVLLIGLSGLATGITFLQVTANAYIIIAGTQKYSAARLCLAGAINSIGAALGPYIGNLLAPSYSNATETSYSNWIGQLPAYDKAFYINHEANAIKGPYILLSIILFILSISIVYNYIPSSRQYRNKTSYNLSIIKKKQLWLGVIGIFCYVGAEVGILNHLEIYFETFMNNSSSSLKQYSKPIYMGLAMLGRIIGFVVLFKTKPRPLLLKASLVAIILLSVALLSNNQFSFYSIIMVGFCNSVMFPIIYILALRGFERDTITASSFLTMGIVGGAIIPLLITWSGSLLNNYEYTLIIPLFCYVIILIYTYSSRKKTSITSQSV